LDRDWISSPIPADYSFTPLAGFATMVEGLICSCISAQAEPCIISSLFKGSEQIVDNDYQLQ
jgi:hypothetical protein